MLYNIYLVCFLVGILYSILSLIFNGLLDNLDFDFDFGDLALPLKPFTIMVFVTVFGGVGIISTQFLPQLLSLVPAGGAGVVVAGTLHHLIYVKLSAYQTETASEKDAVMSRAEVVERIVPSGYGKISYVMDGNILSGIAKEIVPGEGIDQGRSVYILKIQDNVHYVCEDLEFYLSQRA